MIAPGRPPGAVDAPLIGRADDLQRLAGLAADALAGDCSGIVLEGEPGAGKTTLLRALARECETAGTTVLRCGAAELDRHLPFSTILSCPEIASAVQRLRARPGGLDTSAAFEFNLSEAILDELETSAPIALLVDDLHWADPASLLVLHRLGRVGRPSRVLVVATVRPGPRSAEVDALLRGMAARGGQLVRLGPLGPAAVAQLAAHLLGTPAGPDLLDLVAQAEGNPMLVTELVSATRRNGRGSVVDGVAGWLGRLSPGTRELLRVAALLGDEVELGELSAVLGTPAVQLWPAIAEATDRGLLVETGERLRFRHGLMRQAFAEEVSRAMRTALHLQIGLVLARRGAPPERVAEHLLTGGDLDTRAADWLLAAAPTLTRRAPETAVRVLRRALGLAAPDDPRASRLRARLGVALLHAGHPRDAAEIAERGLSTCAADERGPWLRLLVAALGEQGRHREALAHARGAPDTLLVARCQVWLGELPEAAETGLALASAAPPVAGPALLVAASARLAQRRVAEALDLVNRAAARFDGREPESLPVLRGLCLIDLDRLTEADRALGLEPEASALGLAWRRWARAVLRFVDGRWDAALAEVDATPALGGGRASATLAALVGVRRGEAPKPVVEPFDGLLAPWHTWLRALTREYEGEPDEALALLVDAWQQGAGALPPYGVDRLCADLARLWLTTGTTRPRRILGDVGTTLAARAEYDCPAPSLRATAALCTGVADRDTARLRSAAEEYERAGRPLYAGQAWECAALVLAERQESGAAQAALDRALAQYDRLGAAFDHRRARQALAGHGVRPSPRRGSAHRASGWEALTVTEHRIASLVATGRSNAEIAAEVYLSRRTVQYHVSNVLDKLGLTSRIELVRASLRRDSAG